MERTPARIDPPVRVVLPPGVLITPHIGGDTTAFPPRVQRLLTAQLCRYCIGEPLMGVVAVT